MASWNAGPYNFDPEAWTLRNWPPAPLPCAWGQPACATFADPIDVTSARKDDVAAPYDGSQRRRRYWKRVRER